MSAANPLTEPDRDIPLTEIPKTIRDLRASWAQAYSRAEKAERELALSRTRCADWEAIALENGERAAQLNVTLAKIQKAADEGDDYYLQLARKERDFAREEVRRLDVERLEMVVELDRLRRQLDDRTVELDRVLREATDDARRAKAQRDALLRRIDALVDFIDPFESLTTDDHRELAQQAGVECINCEGRGFDVVQGRAGQCPDCHGIGWKLRGAY